MQTHYGTPMALKDFFCPLPPYNTRKLRFMKLHKYAE